MDEVYIGHKKPGRVSRCPDPQTLVDLYRTHTADEIGEMYGVSGSRVRVWLREAKPLAKGYPERGSVRPDSKTLAELYASHTAREIAEQYGVCLNTVRNWISYYRKKASEAGDGDAPEVKVKIGSDWIPAGSLRG